MSTQIAHDVFTIERTHRASRERAYRAWADFDKKAKWFVGPAGRWTALRREQDFSVGGQEVVVGDFEGHGTSGFFATYQDIVPLERIVYSYRMFVDEVLLSISLVTVEFHDEGSGSKTVFTEQGVYFGDPVAAANRRQGSDILMDNIARSLDDE
jgi:uncharacterized protein YndB with AHSA1/START domain